MSTINNYGFERLQAVTPGAEDTRVNVSNKEALRKTAEEFESLFVKMLLDSMRDTRNKENQLIDGGMGEEIFEDMLYTEYSRKISKSGNFGIADMIYQQYENVVG
jgi:flagellar protein FlgJ